MVQWIKDPALSMLWLRLLHGTDSIPESLVWEVLHAVGAAKKKKKVEKSIENNGGPPGSNIQSSKIHSKQSEHK